MNAIKRACLDIVMCAKTTIWIVLVYVIILVADNLVQFLRNLLIYWTYYFEALLP